MAAPRPSDSRRGGVGAPQRLHRHRPQSVTEGQRVLAGVDHKAHREPGTEGVAEPGQGAGVPLEGSGGQLDLQPCEPTGSAVGDEKVYLRSAPVPEMVEIERSLVPADLLADLGDHERLEEGPGDAAVRCRPEVALARTAEVCREATVEEHDLGALRGLPRPAV